MHSNAYITIQSYASQYRHHKTPDCIAQSFVRRYPDRIERVVFSHTTIPNEIQTGLIKFTLKIARHYPVAGLRLSSRFNIMKLMKPPKSEKAFWNAYWKEKYNAVTDREGFINAQ
jgi:hypothetical protein